MKRLNGIGFIWKCRQQQQRSRSGRPGDTMIMDDDDNDESEDKEKDKQLKNGVDEDHEPMQVSGSTKDSSKVKSSSWDAFYALLVKYEKENGHTRVPQNYKANPAYGRWMSRMRYAFACQEKGIKIRSSSFHITRNQIKRLNQIGMVWDCRQNRRSKRGPAAAAAHKDSELHEDDDDESMLELHSTENSIAAATGTAKSKRLSWDDSYKLLLACKQQHGHTRVPQSLKLGVWVAHQRSAFSRKQKGEESHSNRISETQIQLLNKIGMVWSCRQSQPRLSKSGPAAAAQKDNKLQEEQDDEHDESMMEPRSTENSIDSASGTVKSKRLKWNDSYELRSRRGPAAHDNEPLEENVESPQNKGGESEKGKCTSSRPLLPVDDLMTDRGSGQDEPRSNEATNDSATSASTGTTTMLDTAPRASYWNEMFESLLLFKEQHGHMKVSSKDNPQLRELEQWIGNQRKAYRRKQQGLAPNSSCYGITRERIECLQNIGFSWSDQQPSGCTLATDLPACQESPKRKRQSNPVEQQATSCDAGAPELVPRLSQPAQSFYSNAASAVSNDPCNDQHADKQQQEERTQQPAPKKRQRNSFDVSDSTSFDENSISLTLASKMPRWVSVASTGVPQVHGVPTAISPPPNQQQPPHQQQQQQQQRRLLLQQQQQQRRRQEQSPSLPREHRRRSCFPDSQQESLAALVVTEVSPEKICFKDIVGYNDIKSRIDDILLTFAPPQSIDNSIFTGLRSDPPSIFLYGPTGCGKTELARAIAGEAKAAFLYVAPSDILGKPIGELETAIQAIFEKARECATQLESKCAVIFFYQIDTFGSREHLETEERFRSRRVLAELSIQLDNISQNQKTAGLHILVVASTSCHPQYCDPSLLRRFGTRLHVGLPGVYDRKALIKWLLQDIDNNITSDDDDEDLLELTESLDGWSGSDIKKLTCEAVRAPVREHCREARLRGDQLQQAGGTLPKVRAVTLNDFIEAHQRFHIFM